MTIPELIKTEDGSDTLYLRELDEHYHSIHGALQESMHVFISAGMRMCNKPAITFFEVGFGTGLNAWLTALEAEKSNQRIRYITIEKYPLLPGIWEALNYPGFNQESDPELFRKIHQTAWNKEIKISESFSILKLSQDLTKVDYAGLPMFDLIYFDAFSPEKQPELWAIPIFQQLSDHCNSGALFVTYCAKGAVRRSLTGVGFQIERIPGPPGKREMLRGTKTGRS